MPPQAARRRRVPEEKTLQDCGRRAGGEGAEIHGHDAAGGILRLRPRLERMLVEPAGDPSLAYQAISRPKHGRLPTLAQSPCS